MATDKPVTHHVLTDPFLQPERPRGWPIPNMTPLPGWTVQGTMPGPGDEPIEPSGGEEATDALTIAQHAQRRANFAHKLLGDMNEDRMRDQDDVSAMARQANEHFHRLYLGVAASLVLGSANLVLYIVSLLTR